MHSSNRGQSGSNKPINKKNPEWVEYSSEEIEDLIIKLRENGEDPSDIGRILRDRYGVPSVKQATDKKVTEILEENELEPEIPEDLQNLLDKAENIEAHLEENPKDTEAERRLELTEAKIRKVADYHRNNGNIQEDWKYNRE